MDHLKQRKRHLELALKHKENKKSKYVTVQMKNEAGTTFIRECLANQRKKTKAVSFVVL